MVRQSIRQSTIAPESSVAQQQTLPEVHIFVSAARTNLYFWYRDPITNKQIQRSTGTTIRQEAVRIAHQYVYTLYAADNQGLCAGTHTENISISGFSEAYLKWKSTQVKRNGKPYSARTIDTQRDSWRQFRKYLDEVYPQRTDMPIASITSSMCRDFLSVTTRSRESAIKHYSGLQVGFKWAVKQGFIQQNPFDSVEKPYTSSPFVDWFQEEDVRLLLNNIPEATYSLRRLRAMIIVAFLTGMRLSEIIHLQITHLHLDREQPFLMVRNTPTFRTKNGKDRRVRLTHLTALILQSMLQDKAGQSPRVRKSLYVFCSTKGTPLTLSAVENPFREYILSVFSPDRRLRFHSLRHGYASLLASKEIKEERITYLMGHSDPRTTKPYIHAAGHDLSEAIDLIEDALVGAEQITAINDEVTSDSPTQLPSDNHLNHAHKLRVYNLPDQSSTKSDDEPPQDGILRLLTKHQRHMAA